ncbi:MAG: response regulator transcription factor [Anaerolineae bacterium]|nr:response regulator transcription factor [Anaerolineae bacterium]
MTKQRLPYKVFIVEDHLAMRQAYVDLIARENNLKVCGIAVTAHEALEQIPECQPDIVLIDVSLNGMSGIELTQQLKNQYPELLVLIISGHEEPFYARKAIQAGARGYVVKRRVWLLTQAIHDVLEGEIHITP